MEIHKRGHMVIALGVFESLNDEALRDCFEQPDGTRPTVKEIRAHLEELRAKGFKYHPSAGCDNYGSDGDCLGH